MAFGKILLRYSFISSSKSVICLFRVLSSGSVFSSGLLRLGLAGAFWGIGECWEPSLSNMLLALLVIGSVVGGASNHISSAFCVFLLRKVEGPFHGELLGLPLAKDPTSMLGRET